MRLRAALGVVLALVGLAAGCGGGDREFAGITYDSPQRVDSVALPDMTEDGEPYEFRAEPGGLLLVYFGYTNCPDVCPATMTNVSRVLDELGDDSERISVAMVTIDPARDKDVLADYVQSFIPDAHAIATDDDATLRLFAEEFGVTYEVVERSDGEVEVGHIDYLFGVDDAGALAISWPFGTAVDDLTGDVKQLLSDTA